MSDLSVTDPYGDGLVTVILVPGYGSKRADDIFSDGTDNVKESHTVATPDFISAAAAHTMEQSAVRFNDQSGALGTIERMEFQKDLKFVNATVAQIMEQDGLANLLVQLKSSGNYPPNTNVQPS